MSKMWIGSRVRVTRGWEDVPEGAEGTHMGDTRGVPGALTVLVNLDDGRKVRIPVLCLTRAGVWNDLQGANRALIALEISAYEADTEDAVKDRMRDFLTPFPEVKCEVEVMRCTHTDGATHLVTFTGPVAQVTLAVARYAGADPTTLELAATLLRHGAQRA